MTTFNVGDKVGFYDELYSAYYRPAQAFLGKQGVVVKVRNYSSGRDLVTVRYDIGLFECFDFRLTLIEAIDIKTKIERKIKYMWERQPYVRGNKHHVSV